MRTVVFKQQEMNTEAEACLNKVIAIEQTFPRNLILYKESMVMAATEKFQLIPDMFMFESINYADLYRLIQKC